MNLKVALILFIALLSYKKCDNEHTHMTTVMHRNLDGPCNFFAVN